MQNPKRITFQGEIGAYSHLACRSVYPGLETVPSHSFHEAFRKLRQEEVDLAMIPVDNTIAGRVADVHHLIPEGDVFIIGEHFQPIHHCLLGVKGCTLEQLKHVHSHVHALPQCKKLVNELELQAHVHADTAGAAMQVAKMANPEHAAIASSLAAEIYDLEILRENVQDTNHNITRFLILAMEPQIPDISHDGDVITTLTFEVRNIPAALYKSLGGFATNGLSMAKLESYVDENFQVASFYCDVEGHTEDPSFKLALEELGFFAKDVKFLGTYKAHAFRKLYKKGPNQTYANQ